MKPVFLPNGAALVLLAALTVHSPRAAAVPITDVQVTANPLIIIGGAELAILALGTSVSATATADEVTKRDPPGQGAKGGRFVISAHAVAPAVGHTGTSLTTDSVASTGLPIGSAEVTFPTQTLLPGGKYNGVGGAQGGLMFDIQRIQSASAEAEAVDTTLMRMSVPKIDLFAEGANGTSEASFGLSVFATTEPLGAAGSPLEPTEFFFHQTLFASGVNLAADGSLSFQNSLLNASMFDVATGEGGMTGSLKSPLTFSESLAIDVPADIDEFRLLVIGNAAAEVAAAAPIPEPSTVLMFSFGLVAVAAALRGRQPRSDSHKRDLA